MDQLRRRFVQSIVDNLTRRYGRGMAAAQLRTAFEEHHGAERQLYDDILQLIEGQNEPPLH